MAKKKKKTFRQAVLETPEVKDHYFEGKRAIPKIDRNKVELTEGRKCGGSLFIDDCLFKQGLYPHGNRWDYAIDYSGETFFFEVHTASTHEVKTVINKLNWLKNWLSTKAPELNRLKATTKAAFYWVQSNGNHIKSASHHREAAQNGITPISKLILK